MGTWTLWIAFHVGVVLFLGLDLALFGRKAHTISLREAAFESLAWVGVSVAFGSWIFFSHGRGPGLEFFTGYLIEKSLSVDNVFVFLLIFQFFRVDSRYQHRLLFYGVVGALVMRGAMIGVGTILIEKVSWILYVFGAFLLYAGYKLFGAQHSVNPAKNPVMRWMERVLPITKNESGARLFVREGGRWLVTPLFLVVMVLETTDLVFAVDSIPAVFGVTRDPFLVYTSNICAILGLRAFYFLLAGILPYFRYLDEGLAVVLMFIGAKMLAEPWIHIPTAISLAIVCGVILIATAISVLANMRANKTAPQKEHSMNDSQSNPSAISRLGDAAPERRAKAARDLFLAGRAKTENWLPAWLADAEFRALVVEEHFGHSGDQQPFTPKLTVGIAVLPDTFNKIHAACGSPTLADAPADQDVLEFELEFEDKTPGTSRLDILTAKTAEGNGAIARFLEKSGEGIQQLEIDVTNVDQATEIVRGRFKVDPVYPATRGGANGTRVNFFLVTGSDGKKVLLELVEQSK